MDDRIVEFIQALRAAGVRVSLAESADSMRAIEQLGITDRELFKAALRTTLVKEHADFQTFDQLFQAFFNVGAPPMQQPGDAGLSEQEQQQLDQALQQMMEQLGQRLKELLERLMTGQGLTREELEALSQQAGMQRATSASPQMQRYIMSQMERMLGLQQLQMLLQKLEEALRQQGMSASGREQMREMAEGNAESLEQQIQQYVGQNLAKQMAEYMRHDPIRDLTNRPIDQLTPREIDELRDEVRRMAARLRTRAALRNRRWRAGTLDAKSTMRHAQRYGGVPIELKFRRKRLKPKLAVICDISTSMRPHASFMLTLMYELQDIIARTRSFAFIDDMHDITQDFQARAPQAAIADVLARIPPGYYSTDLGSSLDTFCRQHLDAVDRRTTVIVLGDGRNNYNDPGLASIVTIKRHAKRVMWFTPEHQGQWGSGDSDMYRYAPLMDHVHYVSTLKQLGEAIDRLLAG
ncbi:MAG TPA: VWA domain-containing protein [Herpetosiphonaceae bacterium]|nr:VWA domain-containing protein [Herpetosiphonaceae bacterium]